MPESIVSTDVSPSSILSPVTTPPPPPDAFTVISMLSLSEVIDVVTLFPPIMFKVLPPPKVKISEPVSAPRFCVTVGISTKLL